MKSNIKRVRHVPENSTWNDNIYSNRTCWTLKQKGISFQHLGKKKKIIYKRKKIIAIGFFMPEENEAPYSRYSEKESGSQGFYIQQN